MTDLLVIERRLTGYRIALERDGEPIGGKTFLKPGNKGFSKAIGYASRVAAEYDCEIVDRTGRLSKNDCAALISASIRNDPRN